MLLPMVVRFLAGLLSKSISIDQPIAVWNATRVRPLISMHRPSVLGTLISPLD